MRLWLLAAGGVLTAAAATASAQDKVPGYLVIRVLVDTNAGGGGANPFQPPGGFPGEPGDGSPDNPGAGGPGAPPTPGGGRGAFGQPRPGGPGGAGGDRQELEAARSVAVVVPYRWIEWKRFHPERPLNQQTIPSWPAVKHKYCTSFVFADKTSIQFFPFPRASL